VLRRARLRDAFIGKVMSAPVLDEAIARTGPRLGAHREIAGADAGRCGQSSSAAPRPSRASPGEHPAIGRAAIVVRAGSLLDFPEPRPVGSSSLATDRGHGDATAARRR
jgi:hypothetical protein